MSNFKLRLEVDPVVVFGAEPVFGLLGHVPLRYDSVRIDKFGSDSG